VVLLLLLLLLFPLRSSWRATPLFPAAVMVGQELW
jgi:hypothetical protein